MWYAITKSSWFAFRTLAMAQKFAAGNLESTLIIFHPIGAR